MIALLAVGMGADAEVAAGQDRLTTCLDVCGKSRAGDEGLQSAAPVVESIEISGLRRISPQAIRPRIGVHAGDALDRRRVEEDVRTLARLGWFREVRAEIEADTRTADERSPERSPERIKLRYVAVESPFLIGIDFEGSRVLSRTQIESLLGARAAKPRTGEPANDAVLHRAGAAILRALRETGHPGARVVMEKRESSRDAMAVKFIVTDGPKLDVGRVKFQGEPGLSVQELNEQFKSIQPRAWLGGVRGKKIYTDEAFESDQARLLDFYAKHGYPEARVGNAKLLEYSTNERDWFPWPKRRSKTRQELIVPVTAGQRYRFGEIRVSKELTALAGENARVAEGTRLSGDFYSAMKIDDLRRAWFAKVNGKPGKVDLSEFRGVDVMRNFDPSTGTVSVAIGPSKTPPVIVERIEIRGLHKFKDRFVRRRMVLQEGYPFDERALEAGLKRLTRTGYFKPMKKEDVRVEVDEERRTAHLTLNLEEIGQQRISLTGGQSAFGSTLGIVYSVFDLLNREELLSSQLEGGPQSAILLLGLAKDGFLASRGSLAISMFDDVVRPRLGGTLKGPFYTARSTGLNAGWDYAVSSTDTLGVNFSAKQSVTRYSGQIEGLGGIAVSDLQAKTDSRAAGIGWTHDTGSERRLADASISGGWLGGDENVVRWSAEYSRVVRDPIFDGNHAWAFRTYARGASMYSGELPQYARLWGGEEFVRGLGTGELGPYAEGATVEANGTIKDLAIPAGANLLVATNAEYRVPLRGGAEAAAFFDLGSGLLLPSWLGSTHPKLLEATNGILHGSTGVQMSWTIPAIRAPVRAYYAVNLLRLDKMLSLSDGTSVRVKNKWSAFGWAMGALF